jgi:hypothetical protein
MNYPISMNAFSTMTTSLISLLITQMQNSSRPTMTQMTLMPNLPETPISTKHPLMITAPPEWSAPHHPSLWSNYLLSNAVNQTKIVQKQKRNNE